MGYRWNRRLVKSKKNFLCSPKRFLVYHWTARGSPLRVTNLSSGPFRIIC